MDAAWRRAVAVLGMAAMLALSWPAAAQPPGGRPFKGPPEGERPRGPEGMPHRHARDGGEREQRWERHRRLSPEERRALRRDISEHGRELYRPRER